MTAPLDLNMPDLIGKRIEEARGLAIKAGFPTRIIREDSTQYVVTLDYNPTRLNFEVDGGVVTNIRFG